MAQWIDACCQASCPEFELQDPHGRRNQFCTLSSDPQHFESINKTSKCKASGLIPSPITPVFPLMFKSFTIIMYDVDG